MNFFILVRLKSASVGVFFGRDEKTGYQKNTGVFQ